MSTFTDRLYSSWLRVNGQSRRFRGMGRSPMGAKRNAGRGTRRASSRPHKPTNARTTPSASPQLPPVRGRSRRAQLEPIRVLKNRYWLFAPAPCPRLTHRSLIMWTTRSDIFLSVNEDYSMENKTK